MSTPATTTDTTEAAEALAKELQAAAAELASLGASASPSRLERALERVNAARQAHSLAA